MKHWMKPWIAVPLALSLGSSGCVAGLQPPAPLPEVHYAAPAPGMIWIGGSWHWEGTEYIWLPGRWESMPPTPTSG